MSSFGTVGSRKQEQQAGRGAALELPHVLVADDFNHRAGNLLAICVDPLQQRLQPAYVALHVGVQEGQHVTCVTETGSLLVMAARRSPLSCTNGTTRKCV